MNIVLKTVDDIGFVEKLEFSLLFDFNFMLLVKSLNLFFEKVVFLPSRFSVH